MGNPEKELWRAMVEWLEIERQTNERLASVRAELAELVSREEPKPDLLSVHLN